MHTLGIDLASQARTTGVCLLAWRPDRVTVPYLVRGADHSGPMSDTRLVQLMVEGAGPGTAPDRIGIDAPLGWPTAFVDAVSAPDDWPLAEDDPERRLTMRRTDRFVTETAHKVPLSVSADRIAYPAMRAQRLMRRYRQDAGRPVDRSGLTGAICEVYPDPAVSAFGLRSSGPRVSYKGAAGVSQRAELVSELRRRAPWLALAPEQVEACVAFDDCFDALLAALLARAVGLRLTIEPGPELRDIARREGWIHLPEPDALARLGPSRDAG